MKKNSFIVLLVLISLSCVNDSTVKDAKPLFFKKIQTPTLTLEWYQVSLYTSIPPDYVVLSKNNVRDTICQADNIIDVNLFNQDSIVLKFCATPTKYMQPINIRSSVLGANITIDSEPNCSLQPRYRETFTVDEK